MERACPPGDTSPGCNEHAGQPVVARCVGCGRLLCALCRVMVWNRNYCRACAVSAPGGSQGASAPQGGQYGAPETPGVAAPAHYPPPYPPPPPPYPVAPPAHYARRPARPAVFPNAPWGVGEAFVIFFASMAIAATVGLVLSQALNISTASLSSRIVYIFISSIVLYSFLLAGTFYSVVVRHKSTLSAIGIKLEGMGKSLTWGVGLGVPLFIGALGLAYISQLITGPTTSNSPISRSMNQVATAGVSTGFVFLLVFTLVVLAPVCEEIFFRGYLYPALRNRMDMQPAMILNGILFAAAHFELVGFLPRMLLGYGLCYMYDRNRNLAASMLGHALYNALLIVLFGVFNLF